MIHKFNLWYDLILPILNKVVGKKYGCCNKVKNCHKCCIKNGYKESDVEFVYLTFFQDSIGRNEVIKNEIDN